MISRSFASRSSVKFIQPTHTSLDFDYPGSVTNYSSNSKWVQHNDIFPTYRILKHDGSVDDGAELPDIAHNKDLCIKLHKHMLELRAIDDTLYQAQRMGEISFYMTSYGEEATHFGCAAALQPTDQIWGQYRELGLLLYRGFTPLQITDQNCSNHREVAKGRQMPVHYCATELNFSCISSPLTTQLPQAVGASYAGRLVNDNNITVAFFGDGSASEGDAHPAMNFAAVLDCPTMFFCRNNGFAISTPTKDQFIGDGIVARGPGYGINSTRVDGGDLFAVYSVTKEAREYMIENSAPTLIEAMSYRAGHHSTSDDSTRYRDASEIKFWLEERSPITRFGNYLEKAGWWKPSVEDEEYFNERVKHVRACLAESRDVLKASPVTMFDDVYQDVPQRLVEQRERMIRFVANDPDFYHLEKFEPIPGLDLSKSQSTDSGSEYDSTSDSE